MVAKSDTPISDKLELLFAMQEMFGSKFNNFKEISKDYKTRQTKTLEFLGHLDEELIEMRRELPIRKHWSAKKDNMPEWDKVLDEFVDALHFYLSIALINGWTADDIFNAYCKKNNINFQRQKENY